MNETKLREELTYHEGYSQKVYKDSLGYLTAGIGHLLTKKDGNLVEGQQVTFRQIDEWFDHDVREAIKIAKDYLGDAFDKLTEERQRVIVNLCFNLGPKIHQFKTLKASILLQRWDLAGNAMRNSKWFTQVGRRGPELVSAMETGIISYPK
jgi:lysozyme